MIRFALPRLTSRDSVTYVVASRDSVIYVSAVGSTPVLQAPVSAPCGEAQNTNSTKAPKQQAKRPPMEVSAFAYHKFVSFALEEAQRRTELIPLPLQEQYKCIKGMDGKTLLRALSFKAPKVRLQHSLTINGGQAMQAWLDLMDEARAEQDESQIVQNYEAQHRYLAWRAEKDSGQQLLMKSIGETLAKDIIRNFLFNGVDTIGSKTFLDYFPEYQCADGTINKKRSIIGKSFATRPWDAHGEFIGTNI